MQWLLIFSISETYAQPVINSFSPVSGGRYKFITINGTGFSNVTAVKFGGTPALYFNSVTPGLIYATVDTGSTGNVTVQTNLGSASKPGFIFLPSPVITSIAPSTGSIGTNVTIKGSHFSSTEAVYFGGIPAQAFTVISDTIIAATVGEGASGSVFITNDGGYGFLDGFTHLGPSINSYLPPGGPPGTTVMIRGNHFTGVTGVTFEGIAASSFTILSDSVIKAVTAPGSFGTLKVSSASGAAFMPGFNIPKITSFNPQSASYNSVCTIKGINFTGATGVTFGDTAALSFTVQSDSVIEAIVGVGSFGSVKVTNTFGSGLSSGFFNFIPQVPVINSFSPDSGKSGTIITIRGTHFSGAYLTRFGNTAAASFSVFNDSTIRAVVANGSSGKVEIYNQAATAISAQNFNFTGPEITSFTPATGSTGDTIIIDGSKFININAVRFGGTASPYFNAISPSQIKAVVGDGSSGNVEVISGSDTARKYGFFMRPHILSFYPTGTGKDSVVTIKGKFFTGVYYVTFGGVSASFTFISDSIIKAVVPANGYGSVNVYASGGIASSPGFILIKPPELSGYSPYVGGINTEVAIFGYYLDSVKEVKFGGVDAASFNIVSSTQLTARVGAGATGSVTVKSVGGEATFFGFNYYKKPVITSFSPAKAGPMDIITIRGSNLNGIRVRGDSYVGFLSVKFDSVEQVRLHDYNDTIIKVSPGAGATGKIYVQTPGGQDSISGFVYLAVPVISSIEPIAAPVASAVIITGNNFSNAPDSNFVYFGNARAAVTSSTNTSLTVIVPPGATFEPLSVTVNTKTAYSQRPFIVTYPQDSALFQKAYSTRIDLPLGYKPLAKLADVDGDGKSDLVIADKENNKISVYKNNSTPGLLVFEPKLDFYTGSNPVIQEIKDLDGDGKLDILLVRDSLYDGNARLSVLKNTGNNSGINFLYSNNIGYSYGLTSGTLSDLNSDGKPDLVLRPPAYTNIGSEYIDGLQNYNTDTSMNFSLERSINVSNGITISGEIATASKIIPADFNNDGRNDLLIGLFRILPNGYYFPPYITLLKNDLWSPYNTNFSKAFLNVPDVTNPRVGDLNFDNLPDIISDTVSLINTGNFTFTPQTNTCIECDFIGDMDGDGKPDLGKLKGDTFEIVRNKTTVNGEVTLTSKISFFTGTNASYYTIGDIDGDGKPDIIVSRFADSIISILKNKVAETIVVCPGDSLTLTSSLSGNSYQWQLNSGNGFGNISDNVIYSGTNTAELQLKPVSDSSYGYIYRCLVAGKTSYPYTIKFENNWNGNVSQAWENAANWSCITVPGATSDVTINSGNVIISSNAIVKSLTVKPGAKVTVAKGYSLTVLK